MKEFSERLKELRQARNLTQTQLADAVGVSFATISKWERMQRQPTLENIKSLCKFFKVSSDFLIGLEY